MDARERQTELYRFAVEARLGGEVLEVLQDGMLVQWHGAMFVLGLTAPADPELLVVFGEFEQAISGDDSEQRGTAVSRAMGDTRLTRIIPQSDSRYRVSAESVLGAPDLFPSVELVATVLPRLMGAVCVGAQRLQEELVFLGAYDGV